MHIVVWFTDHTSVTFCDKEKVRNYFKKFIIYIEMILSF